jgi:hypothetical protein
VDPAGRTKQGARFRGLRGVTFATGSMLVRTLTESHAPASNNLYIIVDGATHDSLVAERELIVVVDAIRRILETARTESALMEPLEMP